MDWSRPVCRFYFPYRPCITGNNFFPLRQTGTWPELYIKSYSTAHFSRTIDCHPILHIPEWSLQR